MPVLGQNWPRPGQLKFGRLKQVLWTYKTKFSKIIFREEFEKKLRSKEKYYHINHDFHILMNEGGLDKDAVQGWVANRFYYQTTIPIKDAAIMSNCTDRDARRQWILALRWLTQ